MSNYCNHQIEIKTTTKYEIGYTTTNHISYCVKCGKIFDVKTDEISAIGAFEAINLEVKENEKES